MRLKKTWMISLKSTKSSKTTWKTRSKCCLKTRRISSKTTPPTVLEIKGKPEVEAREFHFINYFNYVVGVRFTARVAQYVEN